MRNQCERLIKYSSLYVLMALTLILIFLGCSNNSDIKLDEEIGSIEKVSIVDELVHDEINDKGHSFDLDDLPDTDISDDLPRTDISETGEEKQTVDIVEVENEASPTPEMEKEIIRDIDPEIDQELHEMDKILLKALYKYLRLLHCCSNNPWIKFIITIII